MNKLNWSKKGRIFHPDMAPNWGYIYAQVPWPMEHGADRLRIYFTSRTPREKDGMFTSYVFSADFDRNDFSRLHEVRRDPILKSGDLGDFDEFGTMPCSVVHRDDLGEIWLYYVGWTRVCSVPYNCAIGLAISNDGGSTFHKYSKGPIVGAGPNDPFILGCPRVYRFKDQWYMWYISGVDWIESEERFESVYTLKVALSDDGVNWNKREGSIVPPVYENECQTCASVFKYNGLYHMYFTYRYAVDFRNPERGYRIGYAYSHDLTDWERADDLGGISISPDGWDSEMICYPCVFQSDGSLFMFYSGNYFGRDGFGYASLDS